MPGGRLFRFPLQACDASVMGTLVPAQGGSRGFPRASSGKHPPIPRTLERKETPGVTLHESAKPTGKHPPAVGLPKGQLIAVVC